MTTVTECPTGIVENAPASDDAFGTHARVANAIADLILTTNGGRTIGLEGRWGSGKSTLVNILGAKLRDPAIRMVRFDAWSHEGDPLRRAFLERAIFALSRDPSAWVAKKKWEEKRDELTGRRSTSYTIPRPQLRPKGAIAAVLSLLIPIGATILGTFVLHPTLHLALIGIAMVLIGPLFAAFAVKDLVALKLDTRVETESTTTIDSEPTSVDFERLFRELLEEAIGSNQGRRLVIVVDNLDRLQPSESVAIWSTLQTFLQQPEAAADWLKYLWVVFPYDPKAIRQLWASSDDKKASEMAASFLDKSVQLRFEVPPPALSNWRERLTDLLQVVLPSHPRDECEELSQVFSAFAASIESPPTPRELEIFANAVGTLHREWGHVHPLTAYALYVVLRRGVSEESPNEIAARLRSPGFPTARHSTVTGLQRDGLSAALASLAFGVEADVALQVLLEEPIRVALTQGSQEMLGTLADRPGYWHIIESLSLDSGVAELLVAASTALSLEEQHTVWQAHVSSTRRLKRMIRVALEAQADLPVGEPTLLASAIRYTSSEVVTRNAIASFGKADMSAAPAADCVRALVSAIVDTYPPERHGEFKVAVPVSSGEFVSLGSLTAGDTPAVLSFLTFPNATASEVTDLVASSVAQGDARMARDSIRLASGRIGLTWAPLCEAAQGRLRAPVEPPESLELLLLLKTPEVRGGAAALSTIVSEGYALHYIQNSSGTPAIAAQWLLEYLQLYPGNEQTERVGSGEEGAAFIRTMNADPVAQKALLSALAAALGSSEAVVALCERLITGSALANIGTYLPIAATAGGVRAQGREIVEHWSLFRAALGVAADSDHEQLVDAMRTSEGVAQALVDHGFDRDLIPLYRLLLGDESVDGLVRDGLDGVPVPDWESAFRARSEIVELVVDVLRAGELTWNPRAAFVEAVTQQCVDAIRTRGLRLTSDELLMMIPRFSPDARRRMIRSITLALRNDAANVLPTFFEEVGPVLVSVGTRELLTDSDFVDALAARATRRDVHALKWTASWLDGLAPLTQQERTAASSLREIAEQEIAPGHEIEPDLQELYARLVVATGGSVSEPEVTSDGA